MKKIFRITTQSHPNSTYSQDTELHTWLVGILTDIAQRTRRPDDINMQGATVDVIVEVLDA